MLKKKDNTIIKVIGHVDGIRACGCQLLADFRQLSAINDPILGGRLFQHLPLVHCDEDVVIEANNWYFSEGLLWSYPAQSDIPTPSGDDWYWLINHPKTHLGDHPYVFYSAFDEISISVPADHTSIGKTYRLRLSIDVIAMVPEETNNIKIYNHAPSDYETEANLIHTENITGVGLYSIDIEIPFLGEITINVATEGLIFNTQVYSILPVTPT